MVDLSVRTRRPAPPAGTRPFAAPLDDAARRNDAAGGGADSTPFTSWFDCPEPSLPRYDAVTGPLPRIAPLPDDRAPEAPATPRTEPVHAVPVAAVMFPAEPVAAELPAGELVWAEPPAVEPVDRSSRLWSSRLWPSCRPSSRLRPSPPRPASLWPSPPRPARRARSRSRGAGSVRRCGPSRPR